MRVIPRESLNRIYIEFEYVRVFKEIEAGMGEGDA
jgi:hypothetical protein